MLAKERQEKIVERIRKNGAVTTEELVRDLCVSSETVRRDLLVLEKKGLLQRVHGGAVAAEKMKPYLSLDIRVKKNETKKKELAKYAAAFIEDGDVIGIDAGSTAIYFAEALKEKAERLTIITFSLDVFQILKGYKKFEVLLCAGKYFAEENVFGGMFARDMMRQLHMQKAFIFPSAVSLQFGICDRYESICEMQRHMMQNAESVFVLADSDKFECRELIQIADMNPEYTYVTDSGFNEGLANLYTEQNITIVRGEK